MNEQEIHTLLQRYLDAATTVDEEKRLYEAFASTSLPPSLQPYRPMFLAMDAIALPPEGNVRERHLWRWAAAVAASVAIVAGIFVGRGIYQEHRLTALYGGSYMIVNGKMSNDLHEMQPVIEQTLADAQRVARQANSKSIIEDATDEVLDGVDDPAQREYIMQLLKE